MPDATWEKGKGTINFSMDAIVHFDAKKVRSLIYKAMHSCKQLRQVGANNISTQALTTLLNVYKQFIGSVRFGSSLTSIWQGSSQTTVFSANPFPKPVKAQMVSPNRLILNQFRNRFDSQ